MRKEEMKKGTQASKKSKGRKETKTKKPNWFLLSLPPCCVTLARALNLSRPVLASMTWGRYPRVLCDKITVRACGNCKLIQRRRLYPAMCGGACLFTQDLGGSGRTQSSRVILIMYGIGTPTWDSVFNTTTKCPSFFLRISYGVFRTFLATILDISSFHFVIFF